MVIAVGFDEIEDLGAGIGFTGEGASLKHFILEGAHERFDVGGLAGSGIGGVVETTTRNCENLTDGPDAVACLLVDLLNQRP